MPRKGHAEEQIIAALQQSEAGGKTSELAANGRIGQAPSRRLRNTAEAAVGVQELRELAGALTLPIGADLAGSPLRHKSCRTSSTVILLSLNKDIDW